MLGRGEPDVETRAVSDDIDADREREYRRRYKHSLCVKPLTSDETPPFVARSIFPSSLPSPASSRMVWSNSFAMASLLM